LMPICAQLKYESAALFAVGRTVLVLISLFAGGLSYARKPVKILYLPQNVNHQRPSAFPEFKQKVYIYNEFAESADAPVLLFICGDQACEEDEFMNSSAVSYAKSLGARIVAVEHRYYGSSQPFPSWTTKNLRFLTLGQAMEDLASIQDQLR